MPLYDFRCNDCQKTWEQPTRVGSPCPPCECGGLSRRVILTAARGRVQSDFAGELQRAVQRMKADPVTRPGETYTDAVQRIYPARSQDEARKNPK